MLPLIIILTLELLAIVKLARTVSHARAQSMAELWGKSIGLILLILGLPIFIVFFRHW